MDALTKHFTLQASSRDEFRLEFDSSQTIIADEIGRPMNPLAFTAAFRRALKRAGLRDSGPHIMRHTFATLALQSGADVLTVSRAMGHHNPGFTLREYGHILAAQTKIADRLDAIVRLARVQSTKGKKTLHVVSNSGWATKWATTDKKEKKIRRATLTV